MADVLQICGLDIDFTTPSGARQVVTGVDLTVGPGEIVALVGESGSGKSLTALSVLGLLPERARASGSIELTRTQVVGADEDTLRSLRGTSAALVFQEPQTALNPVQTVGRQIREALRAHALRRGEKFDKQTAAQRAVDLLRQVDLPDPENRISWYPHQLSGGQKQRVVIALALSGDPELLIADEPTTALDVTVQAEILRVLRRLRDTRQMAVLLITHNLGVVADIADRVVVLKDGRVVEAAAVDQLFAAPQEEYTRTLLAAVPRLATSAATGSIPPDKAAPVVSLAGVSLSYPARHGNPAYHVLTDISLSLDAGETLGLVGESGSGKTTIGRLALGLVTATSGVVSIDGVDLATANRDRVRKLRRGLALIHQDPAASLDPRLTIGASIAEPLVVHGTLGRRQRAGRVAELLDSVRLPLSFASRRPAELSGGQRQRVALARALALGPRLLVADEPTSALDVSVQAAVLTLFTELRAQYGFACLFISHDLAVVNEVADRVGVLAAGRLVEFGSTEDVFVSPTQDYTRRLVASVPVPDPVQQRQRRAEADREDLR
ncbi:MAG: ABC transporter ATP-binding protein [Mycobacterium sp.]